MVKKTSEDFINESRILKLVETRDRLCVGCTDPQAKLEMLRSSEEGMRVLTGVYEEAEGYIKGFIVRRLGVGREITDNILEIALTGAESKRNPGVELKMGVLYWFCAYEQGGHFAGYLMHVIENVISSEWRTVYRHLK